jgi:hypothetical protein
MRFAKSVGLLFALLLITSLSQAKESAVSDDQSIESAITRMLFAIDQVKWRGVRAELADDVKVDYTSLFGGTPEKLKADVLLERWQGLVPGFTATQHLTGPIIVTARNGNRATAETHVRGYHYMEGEAGDVWMVAGHYVMEVEQTSAGWKISGIQLDVYRQEGNRNLVPMALERVKQGRGRPASSKTD